MDWFKMQTVWGASIERFSDAEAGRFIKAVYAYVRHGEEYDGGSGREDPVIWQALETLRGDIESFKRNEANQKAQEEALKEKRRAAAKARWQMQNDASASKCIEENASASESTICIASASQNKNKNKEKEDIKKRVSKDTLKESAAFDTFWTAYPRHTNKKAAQQAFQKINPDADLLNIMLQSVAAWKLSQQWTKDGGQYIPHAATWLNGRRWEDEVPKAVPKWANDATHGYTQREYQPGELDAIGDDLMEEARKYRGQTA